MSPYLVLGVVLVTAIVAAIAMRRLRPGVAQRVAPYRPGVPGVVAPGTGTGAAWSSERWASWRRLRDHAGSDRLAARLRAAGRSEGEAETFRVRQLMHAGGFAAVGLGVGAIGLGSTPMAALLAVAGAAVGLSRAPAQLARAADERRTRMRLELVTIDQVLAIHVRAGAGPVQAITRVVDRGRGEVVEELRMIIASIRTGRSEADAFRHAALTTAEPHAGRTYRLFALAAEQGADLGVALRALSDDLRAVRRDELRRQATRRRAAMLVPTIAILAPIMLLFVIAPLPSIVLGGR
jgi:tight adherence protein C